jgi:hypothetical protein
MTFKILIDSFYFLSFNSSFHIFKYPDKGKRAIIKVVMIHAGFRITPFLQNISITWVNREKYDAIKKDNQFSTGDKHGRTGKRKHKHWQIDTNRCRDIYLWLLSYRGYVTKFDWTKAKFSWMKGKNRYEFGFFTMTGDKWTKRIFPSLKKKRNHTFGYLTKDIGKKTRTCKSHHPWYWSTIE